MNIQYKIKDLVINNFYNKEQDREIKITNLSQEIKNIKIHYYYSSTFFPYYELNFDIKPNTWFKPDTDVLKNCAFIFLEIDGKDKQKIDLISNKNLKKIKDKIICVGLNKTGTSSLTENLHKLGLNVWAGYNDPKKLLEFSNYTFQNKSIGNTIDLVEKTDVDFFQDIPFSCPGISEKIINILPQARYILTVRESSNKWVKSVKNFWKNYFVNEEFKYNMIIGYHNDLYGNEFNNPTYLFNMFETWDINQYEGDIDEKLTKVYENHINSVKNTLISNNCDWIEIDVSKKGELKKLTEWLNIENNEEDFLWINKTYNKKNESN